MKKTILIVDDNSANLYMLKCLLEGEGLEVIAAENGQDALDKAHAHPPDLIVSDILMPVMDGYSLCREWKSDDTLKHIPFVFYTAEYTDPRNEKFALSLGAARFILKPQEPDRLIPVLQEILEEKYTVKHPSPKPLGEEMEFFREHNEILFSKLEKKILDLEIANQQLKILEERYRLSFENVSDVIYTIDTDLNVLNMSPSVEKILGYKPQDFIGRPVSDVGKIFTPESFERAIADISLIFKGETIPATVYEFVAKDGTIKVGEVGGSPIMRGGQITGLISVARDITERKRAEEALKESEVKYRLVVENAEEAILIAQNGMLKYVNPMTISILGYSEEELISKPFIEIIHPDDREKLLAAHIERMKGEETQPVQHFRVVCMDGSVKWADSKAVLISWHEKPATLNFITDVTERKKADEERQQGIERIRKTLGATVQAIAVTVETRDPYTAGHQRRVADLARTIATEMNLTNDQIDGIRTAAIIHDLGKISVPAEILSKPSRLTDIQFSLIKTHAQSGYDILKDIEFSWPIARMVLEHHERMDGSGYPHGLAGGNLLVESRILSVADVVEAMASHRPYRPALGLDKALEEITKNRGLLYDPDAVDACLRLFHEKNYKIIG